MILYFVFCIFEGQPFFELVTNKVCKRQPFLNCMKHEQKMNQKILQTIEHEQKILHFFAVIKFLKTEDNHRLTVFSVLI